ncbi:hypothetical protein A2635_01700 [Candidatus Peribacteria bacterium RIFCSPHIGHO2_01_FULL_51_9]|nr:MAG: hypothetical protein A2635_01700 [Candidatus Peribacteria bacterium RIFCSPHIGHO2_01_FULL_51_9]
MQTIVSIPGIHCEGCANLIKDVSSEFPQIQNVAVDMKSKNVTIDHGKDFDIARWQHEIESLGDTYKVHSLS